VEEPLNTRNARSDDNPSAGLLYSSINYGGETKVKVVTKQPLLERILEEMRLARQQGLEIDHIELTPDEVRYVCNARCVCYGPIVSLFGYKVEVVSE
jgi:hypothetical protein